MTSIVRSTLVALAFAVGATAAHAQPKPALVQDRDEPGRNPWQEMIRINNCGAGTACVATFAAVPTGKRLVVMHASVTFGAVVPGGNPSAFIAVSGTSDFFHMLSPPSASGGTLGGVVYVSSGPTLVYVNNGQTVQMTAETAPVAVQSQAIFSLSGYFVDVP